MSSVNDWETRALERRCAHCDGESSETVLSGRDYLRVLQGLRGDEAMTLARLVGPFFWSDSDMMRIHLCVDCVARLGIENAATVFTQAPGLPNILQPFPLHRGGVIPPDNVCDGGSAGETATPKAHPGAPHKTSTRSRRRAQRPPHSTSL